MYCSTSLGEILSTGTKNNGEPFVVGRGTEEAPFLPPPVVQIVAFAGIIDEAQVLAEVSPTLVDGLLVEQEDVGGVFAEVVLHGGFATATEDVVASKKTTNCNNYCADNSADTTFLYQGVNSPSTTHP